MAAASAAAAAEGREKMSVADLKERHTAAIEQVNSLREQLKQRRRLLLDTDGLSTLKNPNFVLFFVCDLMMMFCHFCFCSC